MRKAWLAAGLLAGAVGARAAAISSTTVQTGLVVSTAMRANVALDGLNGVHITYYVEDVPTRLRYAYRANGATSFTISDVALDVGPISAMTLSPTNVPHVLYTEMDGDLVHARRTGPTTWLTSTVETNIGTQTYVSLGVGSDLIPQAVYYSSDTRRTAYAQLIGASWSTTTVAVSTFGGPVDLALDNGDNPRIAFYSGDAATNVRRVSYAFPVSNVFTVVNLFDVSAGTTTPGDVSIAADDTGRIHLAVYDDFNKGLDYFLASATGTALAGFPMDTAAEAGIYSDLKMTNQNRPHILYVSTTVGLRQAVFNGGDLSVRTNWSTSTVHGGVNVGLGLSLAENDLGNFMTAYYDQSGGAVNWLTNLSTAVVLTGSVLDFSSVAIPGASLSIRGDIATQAVTLSTATGLFSFGPILEGNYTLTPAKTGFAFVPSSRSVRALGSTANLNFQGALTGFDLQGNLFNPLQGQQVNINLSVLPGHVLLRLYTLQGRPIKTLLDEDRSAGSVSLTWDGRSSDGDIVASGIYLLRLDSEHVSGVKKIAVVK